MIYQIKKMKIHLFIALSSTLFACSEDHTVWTEDSEETKIAFTTSVFSTTEIATRSLPILHVGDGYNLNGFKRTGRTFGVTSYIYNTTTVNYTVYAGTSTDGNTITGKAFENGRFIWEHQTAMHWPMKEETFNFCAYSPQQNKQLTNIAMQANGAVSLNYDTDAILSTEDRPYIIQKQLFKRSDGTPVDRTSIKTDNTLRGMQDDVMYAATIGHKSPASIAAQSPVPLIFRHLLTQIHFDAIAEKNIHVQIKALTLHNVNSKGTFIAPAISALNDKQITNSWTTTDTRPNYHNVSIGCDDQFIIKDYVQSITNVYDQKKPTYGKQNFENTLMLIPQAFKGWDPKNSIETNNTVDKGAYLKIYCDIYQVDISDHTKKILIFGDGKKITETPIEEIKEQYCLYTPIASVDKENKPFWIAGERTTYLLDFGVEHDENGKPTLDPIVILGAGVTTKPWGDGTDVIINDPDSKPESGSGEDLIEEDIIL